MFIVNKDREEKDKIIEAYKEAQTVEELKQIREKNKPIIEKLLSQYQTPINHVFQQRVRELWQKMDKEQIENNGNN